MPRHAERRAEVVTDLKASGFEVVLRSRYQKPITPQKACLVVDTTGELRDWTAHADLVMIGKSWLGEGGQNPAEAIVAGIPVVSGPHMGNFEPLVSMLRAAGGMRMLASADELGETIEELIENDSLTSNICQSAREVLSQHTYAIEKTLELLHLNASVRKCNV